MHIIIPMAGHSRRFQEKGWATPKYMIPIAAKAMIQWVCDMFNPAEDVFHFVVSQEHRLQRPMLIAELRQIAPSVEIIEIDAHEKGPVYTAMQVSSIPNDVPIIITYCDLFVVWDYAEFLRFVALTECDLAIPSFRGFHPASFGETYYAYMRHDDTNQVLELQEKKSFTPNRHLEFASAGIYYFRTFELFWKYAQELQQTGYGDLAEGYVSLLANPMIRDGLSVRISEVTQFLCFGTPYDVQQFVAWDQYFQGLGEAPCFCPGQCEEEALYWKDFAKRRYLKQP